jgi:antirestriction protein ArdC
VGIACNIRSKRPYTGVNPLILQTSPYQSKWWGTVQQWNALGATVKKRPENVQPGCWGTKIVYWNKTSNTKIDPEGNKTEEHYFFMRSYHVFNLEQVDAPHLEHLLAGNAPLDSQQIQERQEIAERAVEAIPADVRHGGNRAFYSPREDYIQVPHRNQFISSGAYYETLVHELAHWSESRLNWDYKKEGYAAGELRAEITAAYFCLELGIEGADFNQSCSYLNDWLSKLQGDPTHIFKVSNAASKSVDFLLNFSRQAEEQPAEEQPANELVA